MEDGPWGAPDDGLVARMVWEEVLFLKALSPTTQLGVSSAGVIICIASLEVNSWLRGATFTSIRASEPTAEGFPQP